MIQASIETDRVIKACTNYLRKREEKIQHKIDNAINREMDPHTGIFAPLKNRIWPPAKTREEALARLNINHDGWGSAIHEIRNAGEHWQNKAEEMLALSQATKTGFVVLTDDGQWILEYEE